MSDSIEDVALRDGSIRLGQFLKLASLVDSGAQAKEWIAAGLVTVNGEVCTARGRTLTDGDIVAVAEEVGRAAARVVTDTAR